MLSPPIPSPTSQNLEYLQPSTPNQPQDKVPSMQANLGGRASPHEKPGIGWPWFPASLHSKTPYLVVPGGFRVGLGVVLCKLHPKP